MGVTEEGRNGFYLEQNSHLWFLDSIHLNPYCTVGNVEYISVGNVEYNTVGNVEYNTVGNAKYSQLMGSVDCRALTGWFTELQLSVGLQYTLYNLQYTAWACRIHYTIYSIQRRPAVDSKQYTFYSVGPQYTPKLLNCKTAAANNLKLKLGHLNMPIWAHISHTYSRQL